MKSGDRLIRIAEVMDRTSLSRSHIYARIKQGRFPPPIKLGARCVRWSQAAIDHWMEQCDAQM